MGYGAVKKKHPEIGAQNTVRSSGPVEKDLPRHSGMSAPSRGRNNMQGGADGQNVRFSHSLFGAVSATFRLADLVRLPRALRVALTFATHLVRKYREQMFKMS
jgi:hypothetical protein